MTSITIKMFNLSAILEIQLHSQDSCECNCLLFFDILYIYALQEFVFVVSEALHKIPYLVLFLGIYRFSGQIVLVIYVGNHVCNRIIPRNTVRTIVYKKRGDLSS